MTTGKYLLCILCIAGSILLLASRNQQRAPQSNLPAEFVAQSEDPNAEALANRSPSAVAENRMHTPFASGATDARATPMSLPITLEENVGQAEKRVTFVGRGKGMTTLLTRSGIELFLKARGREKGTGATVRIQLTQQGPKSRSSRHRTGKFKWRGKRKLRAESNYFLGNDPQLWRTHVAHFEQAEAQEVFPGVSIAVYGNEEGIEYDLRLAPGTDADRLRLNVSGADELKLDSRGNLVMVVADGEVLMRKPAIFVEHATGPARQSMTGDSQPPVQDRVEGGYVLEANGSVGFRVAPHDSNATLVLDPSLSVSYATFLGGAGTDIATSMAMDPTGKLYVGGTTTSVATFQESATKKFGPGGGNADFFIAKLDPTATGSNSLVSITFLGGSGDEAGGLIAVDASGNVAVMGTTTSIDYPVTDKSTRTGGPNDLAITEISSSGAMLIFSTMFGGSGAESTQSPGGIAFDGLGNIFVASDTTSTNLAATAGAFQIAYGGNVTDGFLAVFHPTTTPSLNYCTYFGINAQVGVGGVAVDAGGNAYVAGFTSNPGASFSALHGFQTAYGGDPFDGFLMKIRPSGTGPTDLAYGTFLGGSGLDQALAVAVGAPMPATAYVTGTTGSTDFPTNGTLAGPQTSLKGKTANAFLAAIAQDATTGMTSLAYSTYLGGSGSDQGLSLRVPAANIVYVTGATTSFDFPWLDNFQPFNGHQDVFIAKLDPTTADAASLIYASPLGGTAGPGIFAMAAGNAIVVDSAGHAYVAGQTTAADFPRAGNPGNGVQPICASCQASPPAADAFIVAIQESQQIAPSVSFTAANINFGAQAVGSHNAPPEFAGLVNTGNAPLNISSLGIAGPNASDFALLLTEACMTAPIQPGPACSFEVSFSPSTVGPEQAFLTFSDDGPASPQILELVGIGNGPLAAVTPTSLSFANQPAGTSSATVVALITNLGNQDLNIPKFATGGTGIAQFVVKGDPACAFGLSFALGPGRSCQFQVTFAPTMEGQFQAEIDVFDDSGNVQGSEQVISLAGTGTAPAPIANLLPAQLVFATQAAGTVSAAQTVALTNVGSAAVTFAGIGLIGTDAGSFGIVAGGANQCPIAGGTLAISASCTVAVDFAPLTSGAKSASLRFTDNALGSPQTVPITGDVIAPVIQISPGSLNFALETTGITTPPQLVTLSNTGAGPLTISNIGLTGANANDFRQTNNCPPSLGSGNACGLSVTFSPTATGNRSASVSVVDNAPGSPHEVLLMGAGAVPGVSVAPSTINFAPQLVGTSSSPVNVNVTNTGAGLLAINTISLSGTNAMDFKVTDNCSGNINPNASCTIQAMFDPATIGSKTALLTLTDNAPGGPQSVAVSGPAVDFSIQPATGGAMSATVAAGDQATYQLQVVSLNNFVGTISFSPCVGQPPASTCTATPSTLTVVANSTAKFQVIVKTTAQLLALPGTARPREESCHTSSMRPISLEPLAIFLLGFFTLCGLSRGPISANSARGRSSRSRIVPPVHASIVWILLAAALVSCGGTGTDQISGTPPGTSTLTLTASSSGRTQTFPLSLTVVSSTNK
jgi:hypothetical protein